MEGLFELIFLVFIAIALTNAKKKNKMQANGRTKVPGKSPATRAGNLKPPVGKPVSSGKNPGSQVFTKLMDSVKIAGADDEDNEGLSEAFRPVAVSHPKAGQSRQVRELCSLFGEDRRHDWMAKELREESRHMVWNNFVDLGARHDLSCAAQEAREAHHREHQSGVIDDGVADN